MKSYFKVSLALVASLVPLARMFQTGINTANSSSKEDTTTQSSESKQALSNLLRRKKRAKTHTFVNKSNPGITSTLVYTR